MAHGGACDRVTAHPLDDVARPVDGTTLDGIAAERARMGEVRANSDLIVACACERDLLGGIFDVRHSPVFGILNRRPNGPCRSTNGTFE